MKQQRMTILRKTALCASVLLVLALYAYFSAETKSNMVRRVEYALEDAIEKDFQERVFAELRYFGGRLGRKLKGVTIVTENGPEEIEFKDSIDEDVAHRLVTQYMLAKIHPLHPDTLNLLLQEALKESGIDTPSGIVYTHNGETQYSANDSASLHRPFLHWSKVRTLDVKQTLSVQAWVNVNPWNVFRNMHKGVFWSLMLFLLVTLWGILTWDEDKDPNKVQVGKLVLDKINRKVTVGGKECPLRNQQFLLLLMLAEKPGHTMSREEIKQIFWKDEAGADNRMNNLVSTLRNALKDFPEYRIDNDDKDGYKLSVCKAEA